MALLYCKGGFHSHWKTLCLERNIWDKILILLTSLQPGIIWAVPMMVVCIMHICVMNAFLVPDLSIPSYLQTWKVLTNIQTSHYGINALDTTGMCVFGCVVKDHNSTINAMFTSSGKSMGNCIKWKGRLIVKHKCKGCGDGQSWGNTGNDCNDLWTLKTYYWEDAESLLQTTAWRSTCL